MTTTEQTFASLAGKLNALELDDAERALLGALLHADPSDSEDAEVDGFGKRIYVGNLPVIQGFNIGMPPTLRDNPPIARTDNRAYDLNPNDL